jgi:hypothetical protein
MIFSWYSEHLGLSPDFGVVHQWFSPGTPSTWAYPLILVLLISGFLLVLRAPGFIAKVIKKWHLCNLHKNFGGFIRNIQVILTVTNNYVH